MKKLNIAALAALLLPAAALAQSDLDMLNKAILAYNDGKYEESAYVFYDVMENSGIEDARLQSEYYLAQSYFKMGLYQPALYYYGFILKAGPAHKYYFKAAEGLVNVAEALADDLIVPSLLNKEYNERFSELPQEVLHKINFIIGLMAYRAGKYEEAASFLTAVPKESSYYARSRYLVGIMAVRENKAQEAIDAFVDCQGIEDTDKVRYARLDEVHELSALGLARTYYQLQKFDKSAEYFDKIPRFSPYWDDALFEGAWAKFMNDDTGGALGNLHTLHSPALEGGFYPESHVLKATIYHFACLYDETHAAVDEFMQKYVPMNQAIKPLLEADRELEYYFSLITNDASAGGTAVPAPVKAYLVDNERLQNFRNIVARLDGERKRVDGVDIWRASQMQKTLLEVIDQQRAVLVQVAGKFVKGRLADVVAIINGFEGQAEIVKFETSKAEKELLEQNIDAKERLLGQAIFRPTVPDDRHTYWPFDGEYWPDELGYYRYTLKNACGEDRGGRAASR